MSYREIQEKANDLIYGSEMLAQRQLEMVQHNSYLDKDVVSFSYKQHTIYDPDPRGYAGRTVCLEYA